jgi:dihydropyrimidinase
LSCKEALDEALDARRRGVRVSVETLIQHLLLDKSCAEGPGFEGAKYVMSPPLRDRRHQPILWGALRDGVIQTVATDHAPFDFATQKSLGRNDFTKIPNGIPSLEERIKLLYAHGVAAGKLDIHTFVNAASTEAAKIFGLFPRKGTLRVGSDGDLVVFDPNYRGTISAKTHAMNVDYSAFEGWEFKGRPEFVAVRGQAVVRDAKFVGKFGHGRFLAREPGYVDAP